jgi:TetR/AcrR family acrAB operon transcriptional repressor
MVRRTRQEAAATREALIDAAERVFRAKGVAHATLSEVAAAAGLTRGAIYWHFRDKAELFEAMCKRAAMPMETMLDAAGDGRRDDPLGRLRTMAVLGLTRLARDARTQAVFDVIFHKCEFTADLAPVARRQRAADADCGREVIALIEEAIARGQLPADCNPRLAAQLMKAFMIGIMHEWVQSPGSYDLASAAPALVDALLAGLVANPPRTAVAAIPSNRRAGAGSRWSRASGSPGASPGSSSAGSRSPARAPRSRTARRA